MANDDKDIKTVFTLRDIVREYGATQAFRLMALAVSREFCGSEGDYTITNLHMDVSRNFSDSFDVAGRPINREMSGSQNVTISYNEFVGRGLDTLGLSGEK